MISCQPPADVRNTSPVLKLSINGCFNLLTTRHAPGMRSAHHRLTTPGCMLRTGFHGPCWQLISPIVEGWGQRMPLLLQIVKSYEANWDLSIWATHIKCYLIHNRRSDNHTVTEQTVVWKLVCFVKRSPTGIVFRFATNSHWVYWCLCCLHKSVSVGSRTKGLQ